jgi:hypothetical protein
VQPASIYRQYSTEPAPLPWKGKERNGKQASDETAPDSRERDDNRTPATVFKTKYSDTQRFPTIRRRQKPTKKSHYSKMRIDQGLYKFPYDGPDVWLEDLLHNQAAESASAESARPQTEPQKQQDVVIPETQPDKTSMPTENRTYEKKSIEAVSQEFRDQQNDSADKTIVPKKQSVTKESKSRSVKLRHILSKNNLQSPRPNSTPPPIPSTKIQRQSPSPTATEECQSPSIAEKIKVNEKEQKITPLPPSYFAGWNENSQHPQKPLEELDPDLQTAVQKITEHERNHEVFALIDLLNEWYTKLPKPRVCYFPRRTISGIFNVLSLSDTYNNSIASLYMQIFSDMQTNESILKLSEWTRLIDIAGKGFVLDKDVRVDLALKTFQDMQRWCVVDDSLLTSLLQIAVRAQQWSTASLIDNELYKRKAENLIIWTERVKIAGKQKDLPKVLQVFKDFAASGLPVDIAFINTLLEALLNVGQGDIAESIYLRLRQMIVERYEREELPARTTKYAVRQKRKDALLKQSQHPQRDLFNETENLVPNRSSIRRFISYHCHYTGRMSDVAFYLNEMDAFGFAPNYGTYVDIFHGFFLWHTPDGEWSGEKLTSVYSVIHEGLLHGNLPFAISFVLALTAIRAHGKVFGAEKAREVWEMLKPHLRINENVRDQELKKVRALENLVKMFEERGELPWQMVGGDQLYRVLDWRN